MSARGPPLTEITGRPAYQQIVEDLTARIADGTYPIKEPIPSTNELVKQYAPTSTTSVRAAIRELQIKGLLQGQGGKGVFVARMPTEPELAASQDVHQQVAELSAEVREIADQVGRSDVDLEDIKQRIGRLEAQVVDIYARNGWGNPNQQKTAAPTRRARSA